MGKDCKAFRGQFGVLGYSNEVELKVKMFMAAASWTCARSLRPQAWYSV